MNNSSDSGLPDKIGAIKQTQFFKFGLLVLFVILVAATVWYRLSRPNIVQPITTNASVTTSLVAPQANCDFYAATNGTSAGDGSLGNPWDLQTALNNSGIIGAGDTLCLKGGTYYGVFESNLSGSSGSEVVIRSAPGEWAVLDGYVRTTLTADITPSSTNIPVADGTYFPPDGVLFGVLIDNDDFSIYGHTGNNLTVYQGLSSSHSAGAEISIINGAVMTVNGSYVVMRDFEITHSNPARDLPPGNNSRTFGLNVYAHHSKMVDLVIHDAGQGLGFWSQAHDSTACGIVSYNNGFNNSKGHGIYTQNETGTKYLCDNITFGNFGLGMQMYTTNGGTQVGFTWDGNINFNNGYLFGGQQPMDDLTITKNYLYGTGISLGYGDSGPHGSAIVNNNYVYAEFPLEILNWNNVTAQNNTFYQMQTNQGAIIGAHVPSGSSISNYHFADNHYSFGRSWQDAAFFYEPIGQSIQELSYSQWQALTGDNSIYVGPSPESPAPTIPTGVDIFYEPSQFETGRGNIIVYNYDHNAQVSLDLSQVGLQNGQEYQLRNGQNYVGSPVTTGTYAGGSINVSLSNIHVAQPLTNGSNSNTDTCPEFCVFVVVPVTAGVSDTTPPVLSAGAPSGAQASGTTSVNMTLTTNENATCKYGTTANTAYASIANTFTTTGSTSHSKTLTGLTNGTSYSYYIRCQDSSSNANTSDYTISFSVSSPAGDTTAPTVSLTAPANNATVSGSSVTVSANASDNVGVVGVQFKLDGTNLGSEDTSSPYSITWNSTQASNSSHTLTAVARDAAGNSTTSSSVTVTVNNTTPQGTVATPSISPNGGSYSSTQSVSISTATSGASIRYTTDGSTPTSTTGTLYSSAFNVSSTTTVKAIAYKSGSTDSSVTSATFTITTPPSGGGGGGSSGGGGGSSSSGGSGSSSGGGTSTTTSSSKHLVKIDNTYYFIENNVRKGITSPGILNSCGFDFGDATVATAADKALATGPLLLPCGGALVKSVEDPTVYLISLGKRYAFTSAQVFLGLGFKFSSVLVVTDPELQALSRGSDLNDSSSAHLPEVDININGTIYWLDGGLVKHPYPSLEIYNSWHLDGDFTRVVPANSNDLNLITGSVVLYR